MKKRDSLFKIIIKIVATLLAVYFLYYVGTIFYTRNFNKDEIILMEENNEKTELEKLKNRPPINTEITPPEQNEKPTENEDNSESERESQFKISLDDCNDECTNYEEINKINYCKQVCGLSSAENSTNDSESETDESSDQESQTENCEEFSDLKKDYCWRDQAITETNFEKCQKIEDGNIFKQCKNRITEDIIDNQF
ncbi:MAG: hypothetical protein KAT32_04095 [Candidatus Moranbacteria bacterium]|nr:hypothetical protein [Candidatus Moranbacteria bacterium]